VNARRVLVVEDDAAIGRALEAVLAERGLDVELARDGVGALVAADTRHPHLVLLDLGLPDIDGIEVCRRLRRTTPGVSIIILTARDAEMDVVAGLNAGADDYIAKPFRLKELLARIDAQLRRVEQAESHAVIVVGDVEIDPSARIARRGGTPLELRPREFELLLLLARNVGRAITREQLQAEIWNDQWGSSSKSLDVHVSTLRRSLGEPDPITTLRGVGYRLDG
jgi:DNA-binding response OmpR family regulator